MKSRQHAKRALNPKPLSPSMVQRLKNEASDCEAQYAAQLAANPGLPALAAHEIYEIYGSPLLQLHPPKKIR